MELSRDDIAALFEHRFVDATGDGDLLLDSTGQPSAELAAGIARRLSHVAAARRVLRSARLEVDERPPIRLDPDRYEVLEEIARGGMGSIHRVLDRRLGRYLALKVARASTGTDDSRRSMLARFHNEARITGRLQHPGIVPVHELGSDQGDQSYFTMKLVEGVTLLDALDRMHAGDATWPTSRLLRILVQITETLSYAHSRGVVHRDVKPSNVMIGEFGEVYVMDWGVARPVGSAALSDADGDAEKTIVAPLQVSQTLEGDVVGTPAYMSPEQACADTNVGPLFDVYSIGAILYHLLSGHAPYADAAAPSAWDVLEHVRRGPPAPVTRAGAPPELVAICSRAMARDAARRYDDMTALADDLRAFMEHRIVSAHRSDAWTAIRKWCVRRPGAALATGLAAALMFALPVATLQWRHATALEEQQQDRLLVERLRDFRDQSTSVSTGELDHHAAIERFVDVFGREFLPIDGEHSPGAVAAFLHRRCADSPTLRHVTREILYDSTFWMLHSGLAYAEMTRLDPEFVPARGNREKIKALAAQPERCSLWTRVNRVIELFDGESWRAGVWREACDDIRGSGRSYTGWANADPAALESPDITWLAEIAFLFGDREKQVELLARAIDRDVTDYWAALSLGNRYFRANLFEEAVSCFDRARVADPDGKMASTNLTLALVQRSRQLERRAPARARRLLQRAQVVGEEAVRLAPDNHRAHTALGNALIDSRDYARALQSCGTAVAIAPDDVQANINMGLVHQSLGSTEDALLWYAKARTLDPHRRDAYIAAMQVLRRVQRYDEAAELAESAVEAMPADAEMIEFAATELGKMGFFARSLAAWTHAVDLADHGRWNRNRDPRAEVRKMADKLRASVDPDPVAPGPR